MALGEKYRTSPHDYVKAESNFKKKTLQYGEGFKK
jgi:hypothetical protein